MQNEQMHNQQQNQQAMMQQPPHLITTKDFAYLNDMLAWNLLAMKKFHFAASQCQDEHIQSELNKFGQMHQRHYELLLSHLQAKQQNNQMMM